MKKVLIIIGASKSGSTLLAKSIGGHPEAFTLGEANRFNHELMNPDGSCSCGKSLKTCSFWTRVSEELVGKDAVLDDERFPLGMYKQYTSMGQMPKMIPTILTGKKYKNPRVDKEIENTLELYQQVFEISGKQLLIDSTKGLFRALVLDSNRDPDTEFYFIHLVRDGRGVLNSSLKKTYAIRQEDGSMKQFKKDELEKPIPVKSPNQAIHYWLYVNVRNFFLLKLFNRKKTYFLKYEDFTQNPEKALRGIAEFIGLDYTEDMIEFEKHEHHILGGNSSRINAKKIKKQDDAWRENLDEKVLRTFNLKAGWFNKILGYN